MKFNEVPAALRPNSEAGGIRRAEVKSPDRDMLSSVSDRWRASTMSHKLGFESDTLSLSSSTFEIALPLAPGSMGAGLDSSRPASALNPALASAPLRPTPQLSHPQQAPAAAPQQPNILRKPVGGDAAPPPSTPQRWR
jgi:hypothetical protein